MQIESISLKDGVALVIGGATGMACAMGCIRAKLQTLGY